MKFWLVEISDFLPKLDENNRLYRVGIVAKALVDSGHQVLWWSSTFNHQLKRQRFKVSTTVEIQKNYRLRLLYGPGYSRNISFARWKHNRIVAREFAREIVEMPIQEQPDLIYACLPTLEVSEQAVLYGIRRGIPVVVDIRELWPDNYLTVFPNCFRALFRLLLTTEFLRARRILRLATGITSTSHTYLQWGLKVAQRGVRAADKWFALGSDAKTKMQRTALDVQSALEAKGLVLKQNDLVISFVGSFNRLFNFETILEVARDLFQEGEQRVQFILAGDGPQVSLLRIHSYGLENVHLTSWCEKAEVDKILAISSIGLAPYYSIVTPTLPNKPFEYMAAGLPILSSLGGELKTIIEQESIGLQYDADDSNDLKEKIMWFLSHPEKTKEMGLRAKALFEKKYRADVVYADFVKHLEKIANERLSNL